MKRDELKGVCFRLHAVCRGKEEVLRKTELKRKSNGKIATYEYIYIYIYIFIYKQSSKKKKKIGPLSY